VDAIRIASHTAGIPTSREEPIPEGRMDIIFHNLNPTRTFADASVTHPCSKSYQDGASVSSGFATARREEVKRRRYAQTLPRVSEFIPLVCESYGRIGPSLQKLLSKLYLEYKKRELIPEKLVDFKIHTIHSISSAIQQGNARIIEVGLQKSY
jgi:hypothetical protein